MTSPKSATEFMTSSHDSFGGPVNDDVYDLSVLFQTQDMTAPNYLFEINSTLTDMQKDRENIEAYFINLTGEADEKITSLKAELKSKDDEMEKLRRSHFEKEQLLQAKISALRSEFQWVENVNVLSTVYFQRMMKRFAEVLCDGEDFLKSIDCSKNSELQEGKNDQPTATTVSDESDDEVSPNENMPNGHSTAAIEQPSTSGDTMIITDDESPAEAKENVAPPNKASPAPSDQTDDDKIKVIKSIKCKWCDEIIPKKFAAQHKLDVHKIQQKDNKTMKFERVLKRKNANDNQSDDEVSITSVTRSSLLPIRGRDQSIVKPKKAKKVFSPGQFSP